MPKEFPPCTTAPGYFYTWRDMGLFATISHVLVMAAREREGREASPTAGVIPGLFDPGTSQSVKTTESGGPRGGACLRAGQRPDPMDAGKKINGRKRHIITGACGHVVGAVVHVADIQDRDGAPCAPASIRSLCPWLRHVFADSGYAGDKLKDALEGKGDWTIEIVKRPVDAEGFVVVARRWVVERTFAWLGRCRRLAKDFEATIESALARLWFAHIRRLVRKLARG